MTRRLAVPPVLFAVLGVAAVLVGRYLPLIRWLEAPATVLGVIPVLAGMAVCGSAWRRFTRVRTNLWTFEDPGRMITAGPFAHSRNPMYLGFQTCLTGIAILVGTVSALIAPVTFFLVARYWYIPFEEQRMVSVFGPEYTDYARQVRRWL